MAGSRTLAPEAAKALPQACMHEAQQRPAAAAHLFEERWREQPISMVVRLVRCLGSRSGVSKGRAPCQPPKISADVAAAAAERFKAGMLHSNS